MLAEINLLPQREQKKVGFVIVAAIVLGLALLIAAFNFYQIHSAKKEIDTADQQISVIQNTIQMEAQKKKTPDLTNSINLLKSAIDAEKQSEIPTVLVMDNLTALLPNRGFILSFAYQNAGTINVTVQFDSAEEAAYYLNHLEQSKLIADVNISSLTAIPMVRPADTGAGSGTGTNGNQTNSAALTTEGSTALSGTALSDSKQYMMPRYTGQFVINLNLDAAKQILKDGNLVKEAAGS